MQRFLFFCFNFFVFAEFFPNLIPSLPPFFFSVIFTCFLANVGSTGRKRLTSSTLLSYSSRSRTFEHSHNWPSNSLAHFSLLPSHSRGLVHSKCCIPLTASPRCPTIPRDGQRIHACSPSTNGSHPDGVAPVAPTR
ncbi:hypothetical protein BO83DRAFT_144838 [Aspergillus eucalypticola CBS 122712]|uniref:Uncharacterized protein n=1 Tax=Aspergillus eucalypticola (strain CBS 122712 / IBT 29274) TaxID=1448314 RepID=A0A317UUA6_ASPEC|nr:uncharacterized protein BO83DRAFT_144838 [Aspergillus eucalypticola CBS 122712]PWY64127.1 hypothetical protein BO83DRAFT_144838 [Aspergillus eucalypticola CBS 122712]